MNDMTMSQSHETKEVSIKKLVLEGLQIRVEMNAECIEDYTEIYRNWKDLEEAKRLPPITVFYDVMGDEYYLADGFHRVYAAQRAGWEKLVANVYEGTFNDALKYALSANAQHGLRRTNADKQNAMEIAWAHRDKLFGQDIPTERQFATVCGVSTFPAHNFLKNKRLLLNSKTPSEEDGTSEDTPTTHDATTVTSAHLEERNPKIRELLKQHKDRYGVDIPDRILTAFTSTEPREFIRTLGKMRQLLDERRLASDPAFVHGAEYALNHLDSAIRGIKCGQAFCVCRMCRGKGCGSCSGFGFQTKLQYGRVPREYRAEEQ